MNEAIAKAWLARYIDEDEETQQEMDTLILDADEQPLHRFLNEWLREEGMSEADRQEMFESMDWDALQKRILITLISWKREQL